MVIGIPLQRLLAGEAPLILAGDPKPFQSQIKLSFSHWQATDILDAYNFGGEFITDSN